MEIGKYPLSLSIDCRDGTIFDLRETESTDECITNDRR